MEQELNKAQDHIAWLSQVAGTKIGKVGEEQAPVTDSEKVLEEAKRPPSVREERKKVQGNQNIETRVETILSGVCHAVLKLSR